MYGWFLKAQDKLRIAEPAGVALLTNYDGTLKDYCGFTTHAPNAFMWCNGDMERIAESQKEEIRFCSFTDTVFWKNP
jgi:hypothetical protein